MVCLLVHCHACMMSVGAVVCVCVLVCSLACLELLACFLACLVGRSVCVSVLVVLLLRAPVHTCDPGRPHGEHSSTQHLVEGRCISASSSATRGPQVPLRRYFATPRSFLLLLLPFFSSFVSPLMYSHQRVHPRFPQEPNPPKSLPLDSRRCRGSQHRRSPATASSIRPEARLHTKLR